MAAMATSFSSIASWPLYLAGGIFLLGVWIGRNRWLNSASLDITARNDQDGVANAAPNITRTAGTEAEAATVRRTDSQRVDRLHRIVNLHVEEHIDLLDMTFDRIPRLRIKFLGFEGTSHEYARVHVELGGAIAGCGSLVKEVAVNQFLVPRATQDEHRCSILHFHGQGEVVNFLRIKLLDLDAAQHTVTLDVLHVCGHWSLQ